VSVGDLLKRVIDALDAAGVEHMVAGSFASTFHGVPRTTQDIDLVIDPSASALDEFVQALDPARYYVDAETARDAFRRRSLFNVIDMATGWKIDLIMRKQRPFSEMEFSRRAPAQLAGTPVFIATAEDTIIAKLEWAKLSGGSERQLRDVQGIMQVRGTVLDTTYIDTWVAALGLDDLWRQVKTGG
jgi:hypothetical protein